MTNNGTVNIKTILCNQNFTGTSKNELIGTSNYYDFAADSLLAGIGAVGNLMFWASSNDCYTEINSDLSKIGLLINQAQLIAEAFNELSRSALMITEAPPQSK